MSIIHGDCVEVMAGVDADSIDAIVTDPPYGLGFMGKDWDDAARLASVPPSAVALAVSGRDPYPKTGKGPSAVAFDGRAFQSWTQQWATEALRVAKPGAYLLAFGGTRTVHRLTVALEDAGWIIRDCLVWAYAQGFPKSKSSLKPAWEPIVLARKPGPLQPLNIDACRLPGAPPSVPQPAFSRDMVAGFGASKGRNGDMSTAAGRWPANVVLTDPIFDGEASRFFLIPKASRRDRDPDSTLWMSGAAESDQPRSRYNTHPTVKPTRLMRHLVRLVTPEGGTVLDPFLGSGTTAKAAVLEGFDWVGIEREADYIAIAEQRLVGLEAEPMQLEMTG